MTSFVRTPTGVILHVDNHRALVAEARKTRDRALLRALEPAEPIDPDLQRLYGAVDELAASPTKIGAAHAMASIEFAKQGGKGR